LNNGNKTKALQYYKKALEVANKKEGSTGFMLDINNEIGRIYLDQKDYKQALGSFNSALKYAKGLNFLDNRIPISINISNVYFKTGDKKQAGQYLETAKQLTDALPVPAKKIYPYYLIANSEYNYGNFVEAVKYSQAVIDICYEYEKAGQASVEAKQMGLSGLGKAYLSLAKQQGNNKQLLLKSIYSLERVLPLYIQTSSLKDLQDCSQQLAEAYELTGQYSKSVAAYKDFIVYKDSLTSVERENAFVKKEAEFEYSQKEILLKASQKAALDKEQTNRNYAFAGIGVLLLITGGAGVAYSRKRKDNRIIASEKKRSDDLLLNILPAEVAEELKTKGEASAQYYEQVSIIFTDFVGFTKLSEKFSPEELIGELNHCFKAFDNIITKYNIEKIKTIGDSYMAVSGLPGKNADHAKNAVEAAVEMRNFIENYKIERQAQGKVYFEMRTGINSGNVVAGIVGIKKFAYDVWGDAVNIASRMESNGIAGKINISESTFDLIKEAYETHYRGELDAKGKGLIKMYFVERK
ncbi:MAG: adenylate/guanylate cyclase domain-containing protein, partial [Bacteroidota bacterium]